MPHDYDFEDDLVVDRMYNANQSFKSHKSITQDITSDRFSEIATIR
jgi:hypothetical protein